MVGFPFDSRLSYDAQTGDPIYDRAVSSEPLRNLIKQLFTTGVMPNPSTCYQVSASTGMTINVAAGFAVVDGGLCEETDTTTLSVGTSHNTYPRIDTVVLQWNENIDVREASLYVKEGTASANPTRPALTRTSSIYEIGLADILIPSRSTVVTNANITDTRMESDRCGIVSSVSEWDTTTIYQQIQSELAEFKSDEETDFADWFERMKDQLSEDAAGHLQNEIDGLQSEVDDIHDVSDIASTLAVDYSKSVSHIGMIIQSTTLDTEEKVKSIYGGQQWISLSGYVLRGATSGVIPNNNAKDLGNDTHTITTAEMPAHYHSVDRQLLAESAGYHSHVFNTRADGTGIYWVAKAVEGYDPNQNLSTEGAGAHQHWISAHNTNSTGSGAAMSIIPNEKNVYIWERIA